MPGRTTNGIPARRGEVLAALSVAIDLGLGQPAEHMLRSALIAGRLAEALDLSEEQKATTYYATLLMWIGCNADSQEFARWFGDDIAVRAESYLVDWSGLRYARFLLRNVAHGEPPLTRAKQLGSLLRDTRGQLTALIGSHCTSAAALARHLGLPEPVAECVGFTFERFDGSGLPAGRSADAIPIEMRIATLADVAEVHHRQLGSDGAVAMVRARRGRQFDPVVADAFLAQGVDLLAWASQVDAWREAMRLAPDTDDLLVGPDLDAALRGIGDFVDLKCPFTLGHSRAVAGLVDAAAPLLGMDPVERATLRRAASLHDVGRMGVSNQIWGKAGPLSSGEWERVRMHAYFGGRVIARIPGLASEAALAQTHHENLDGSGYPFGLTGGALGRPERLLAAAVAYRSALEPRPYRSALDPDSAQARLNQRVRLGQLDADAVAAIGSAAGHRAAVRALPAGLTRREAQVLSLVARGLTTPQIAETLVLSEKTVRNHVERSYAKIGVSNRVGASLYALSHGLAGLDPTSSGRRETGP